MRILDRYIIREFLINYLLALGVMLGIVTLFDVIVNFRSFAQGATIGVDDPTQVTAWAVIADIVDYYSFQMLVIFQMVSGVIPLLAAGFTMVRMTRHHELTAMLSSGVSLYRVAAPIVLVSMGMAVLHVVNQEYVISQPYIIDKLMRKHNEVNQTSARPDALNFVPDSDYSLLSAREYDAKTAHPQMKDVMIVQRDKSGLPTGHIFAKSATWEKPDDETSETWIMRDVIMDDDRRVADASQQVAVPIAKFTYHTSLTPEQLSIIASKKAVEYLSSSDVYKLITFSPEVNKPLLYKIMHLRFTQPLMNIIMLLLGIPFLLTREPRRLIVNMFYCVIVIGVTFVATFVIFEMAGTKLDPLLAAWLPVLIFGPFALVMLDLIHT